MKSKASLFLQMCEAKKRQIGAVRRRNYSVWLALGFEQRTTLPITVLQPALQPYFLFCVGMCLAASPHRSEEIAPAPRPPEKEKPAEGESDKKIEGRVREWNAETLGFFGLLQPPGHLRKGSPSDIYSSA